MKYISESGSLEEWLMLGKIMDVVAVEMCVDVLGDARRPMIKVSQDHFSIKVDTPSLVSYVLRQRL